jgi:predicted transcriptional regulator
MSRGIGALQRQVLLIVTDPVDGWTADEIAEETGADIRSVRRACHGLAERGMLIEIEPDQDEGRYWFTWLALPD